MNDLIGIAQRAIALMDLTTLNDNDTEQSVATLCRQSVTPANIHTAAVCIYPQFITTAKSVLKTLGDPAIQVATVTNFPHGLDNVAAAVTETLAAVEAGADEVDVVFPYRALMAGNEQVGLDLVQQCKTACHGKPLKVIIETGELKTEQWIKLASQIAIEGGADFIKTSTGKVAVNATPEYARMMLEVIRDMGVQDRVGFKAAGGVRTAEEARQYLDLADKMMGREWVTPRHFRFGASSLLTNLLATLGHLPVTNDAGTY